MELVTRQLLANEAVNRWRMQYERDGKWRDTMRGPTEPVFKALQLLGKNPSPDAVDKIAGNNSWTRIMCSYCHNEVDRAISIDVTGGEYGTHICEPCVIKMRELLAIH